MAITFSRPQLEDGMHIYRLVQNCPPLDLNSSYLYFLQASHFSETCLLAKDHNHQAIGWVSGYLHPQDRNTFFVWQVAVSEAARGQGLAKKMLLALLERPSLRHVNAITTTISPSNLASQNVFKSAARAFDWQIQTEDFLTEAHFMGESHEAEPLYRLTRSDLGPLYQSLIPSTSRPL